MALTAFRLIKTIQQQGLRFLSTRAAEGEVVTFVNLSNLADNPGAVRKGRRIGRGIGCSKGKTSGRGHKGQKARSGGNIHPSFEGGQTKFYKLLPKRGFKNSNSKMEMLGINLGTLQDYVDMGRLDPNKQPLTIRDLVQAGLTKSNSIEHGVKLLARGSERLKTPLVLEVSRASESAIEAMEAIGGEVTSVHYNKLALRALLKPEKFEILPKFARPPPRLMTYYRSFKNRGYLSPQVQMRKMLRNRPELEDALVEKEKE
eukprot:CAMPEP_0119010264 /NCGR_PEP_ID=MMETSP1176-20130426/4902_1 /TAXON_ID=265551 /ORGANISM="Synedropsis recta cf, Strain CCMP1620" /LENGTH=258 /DNA_ID=CAMNT_0006962899 /DNA_START=21 /DNA_END=797 /DNA_ORIENTATION=-